MSRLHKPKSAVEHVAATWWPFLVLTGLMKVNLNEPNDLVRVRAARWLEGTKSHGMVKILRVWDDLISSDLLTVGLSPEGVIAPAWAVAVLRFYGLGPTRIKAKELVEMIIRLKHDKEERRLHVVSASVSEDAHTMLLAKQALRTWEETE